MNENPPSNTEQDTTGESARVRLGGSGSAEEKIGVGKKTGLYGCGLLILSIALVIIVLAFTGIYNPFQGSENVGP